MLTKLVKRHLNFRGYFDLYNIPFKHISQYDFTEKKSPLRPGGMNRGPNIFDFLTRRHIPYFVSDPDKSEHDNLEAIKEKMPDIDFAFMYWPGLDGLLHSVGNQSPEIPAKLRHYEGWITELLNRAREHYREVRLYLFSDHGMANCDELLDLRAKIDALSVEMGADYAVVYDSTMARFWFFNENARRVISSALRKIPQGRIVPDEELRELHALFEDRYFGELIFLVKEGVLIVPSHMGERPIRAMHGYHPSEKHSYAALCTNRPELPLGIKAIPDIFRLMTFEAEQAFLQNEKFARDQAGAPAI
jgi:predicted AlkP superfamily pyrophosphatase or phosphodiesterase